MQDEMATIANIPFSNRPLASPPPSLLFSLAMRLFDALYIQGAGANIEQIRENPCHNPLLNMVHPLLFSRCWMSFLPDIYFM